MPEKLTPRSWDREERADAAEGFRDGVDPDEMSAETRFYRGVYLFTAQDETDADSGANIVTGKTTDVVGIVAHIWDMSAVPPAELAPLLYKLNSDKDDVATPGTVAIYDSTAGIVEGDKITWIAW